MVPLLSLFISSPSKSSAEMSLTSILDLSEGVASDSSTIFVLGIAQGALLKQNMKRLRSSENILKVGIRTRALYALSYEELLGSNLGGSYFFFVPHHGDARLW